MHGYDFDCGTLCSFLERSECLLFQSFHTTKSVTSDAPCEVDNLRAHRELNLGCFTSRHRHDHTLAGLESALVTPKCLIFLLDLNQIVGRVAIYLDFQRTVRRCHLFLELSVVLEVICSIHPGNVLDLHRVNLAPNDVIESLRLDERAERAALFDYLEDIERVFDRLAQFEAQVDLNLSLFSDAGQYFDELDNELDHELLSVLELITVVAVHLN